MPRKTLLLFTYRFPYGYGETFLETELPVLLDHFERVFVIPNRYAERKRALPDANVMLIDDLAQIYADITAKRLKFMLTPFRNQRFYREIITHPSMLTSGAMLKSALVFFTQMRSISEWIYSFFAQYQLDPANTIAYTYWMNGITFGLTDARHKLPNLHVLSRVHGYDLYHHRHHGAYIPVWKQNITTVDRLFTISQHGMKYIRDRVPHTEHVQLSYLGTLDQQTINQPSTDGIFRIVSCASLKQLKRIDRLISGLAHFAKQQSGQQIIWTHLGDGILEDQLKEQAKTDLPSNVTTKFLGQLTNQQVYDYYATQPVDAFAIVSESEGLSVATMEALSFGIPIISTDVGGMAEIANEATGYLLPAHPSHADIADALSYICHHPSINKLRHSSRIYWEEHFNAITNYGDFAQQLITINQ